ncbi:MAG: hypothetical protein AMXMBFR33_48220 [Candidatus Xenobia bacterium]
MSDTGPILEFLTVFANCRSLDQLISAFEQLATRLLPCQDVRLLVGPDEPQTEYPLQIPLTSADGMTVGHVIASCDPVSDSGRAAEALALVAAMALRRAQLMRLAREREVLLGEVALARQILMEMLPRGPLTAGSFAISGRLQAADRLGGDCFGYTRSSPGQVSLLLADAVGHGLGSTLLVSECRAIWRAISRGSGTLSERVGLLNRLLAENTGPERFVAACPAILDCQTGTLELISCGLAPHLMYRARTDAVELLEEAEPPLGIFTDYSFQSQQCVLAPGDLFLAVSDGVLEWVGPDSELFGEERLVEVLHEAIRVGSDPLSSLFQALRDFSRESVQRDDACALLVRHAA